MTKRKTTTKTRLDLGIFDDCKEASDTPLLGKQVDRDFIGGWQTAPSLRSVGWAVDAVGKEAEYYSGHLQVCDGTNVAELYFSHWQSEALRERVDEDAMQEVEDLYEAVRGFRDAFRAAKDTFDLKQKMKK